MTEAEWLTSADVPKLLEYLSERTTHRKFRLFACACCRRIWHLLNQQAQHAIAIAELYADGFTTEEEVEAARKIVTECCNETALRPSDAKYSWSYGAARMVLFETPFWKPNQPAQWSEGAARSAAEAAWRDRGEHGPASETTHQLTLLRDVFENPYSPGWVEPEWLTSTVVALAAQMYESRDFGAMPILADALQDAGCDNDDVLNHSRGPGPHVRGCWVVDLVLGKG
jgi:hypothetical protein